MNSGTNAGWHNGMPTSDMDKESQLLKRIDLKYQELVPLNGEIRQIPANPGKTLPTDHLGSGLDFWRASSQCQEKRAERLQQQVTNQQKALGIKETEIMGLKTQNERLREKVYKLSRENDCQKKLVREKTAVVDALKERSKNVREEKDQLLELNRRFKEDIDALKEERDRQQAEFKKLKEKVTRLEVERDTARNIQKVREEQQQSQGKMDGAVGHKDHRLQDENHRLGLGNRELKKDIREWEKVEREEVEREEVKRELERETDKKATATSNTRYGTLPSRSNTKRSKSGKRYRSSEEPEDSTTLEGGDISSTTKRPRAGKWSDPDDLFTPSLNIPSSEVPSGGLVSVNNGSVAAGSVAIVRKETSPEPR